MARPMDCSPSAVSCYHVSSTPNAGEHLHTVSLLSAFSTVLVAGLIIFSLAIRMQFMSMIRDSGIVAVRMGKTLPR